MKSIADELENREIPICPICEENPQRQGLKTCSIECSKIHNKEYKKKQNREYYKTDKYKKYQKEYQKTDKCKEYKKKYNREYCKTDKYKKYRREYYKKKKNEN